MKKFVLIFATIVAMSSTPALAETEGAWFLTAAVEYQLDSLSSPLIGTGCNKYDFPMYLYDRHGNTIGNGHYTGPATASFGYCTGNNPLAEFKLGYEFAFGDWRNKWYLPVMQFGWKHESHWFDGRPFNNNAETWAEKIFLEFRFGGLR